MIKPTVGRVVWFWPRGKGAEGEQPRAAIVTYVDGDGRYVNLAWFDWQGVAANAQCVRLLQDGEEPPLYQYCEWMPYQKGQAAKTEALEAAAKQSS